jgi:hypothetical protein
MNAITRFITKIRVMGIAQSVVRKSAQSWQVNDYE